jgi:hypothetical protein
MDFTNTSDVCLTEEYSQLILSIMEHMPDIVFEKLSYQPSQKVIGKLLEYAREVEVIKEGKLPK